MRSLDEIQADWDFVEDAPDPELELVQAQQRLYKDIPAMMAEIRRLNQIIRALVEDYHAD